MKHKIKKLTLSAMFLAIGLVLPMVTGQIPRVGNMLLPMHLPVLLGGLICGGQYGLCIGILTPLLRSALFGMPPLFPTATAMAFELGTYGLVIGSLYARSKWKCVRSLYRSMIIAMLLGRVVWGAVMGFLMGITHQLFTWQAFMSGAFLNAIPGIILQFMIIPAIMIALDKTRLVPFSKKSKLEKVKYD